MNPNLYADGKVCLSILGTWSGPGNHRKIRCLNFKHCCLFLPQVIEIENIFVNLTPRLDGCVRHQDGHDVDPDFAERQPHRERTRLREDREEQGGDALRQHPEVGEPAHRRAPHAGQDPARVRGVPPAHELLLPEAFRRLREGDQGFHERAGQEGDQPQYEFSVL